MKNIAWYQVETTRSYEKRRYHASLVGEQNDLQAREITYHCDIQSPDQFGDLFWATACQRDADLYEELVFICNGAVWIWYHASEYLPPIAEAAFGRETPDCNKPALSSGKARLTI
jgi:hypothetical protein